MRYSLLTVIALVGCLITPTIFAQGGHRHGGHFDPDSLTPVTVAGTAIVDTSMGQDHYFLDEDSDGQADYHLNFGPYWYSPDSSNAARPNNGDPVTIDGGLHDPHMGPWPTVVVYQINGEFWRDPWDPHWNRLGHHSHGGGHHQGGCDGHAFGWRHDSLQTVSLTGTALVDTTFVMEHYYLDSDGDTLPDFVLNFGPPWYQPPSGATRPEPGDAIDIVGGMLANFTPPMVMVYEINGLTWRDSTAIGPHLGGGWIHRTMNDPVMVHCPTDSMDHLQMNPGWHRGGGGGHHGGMPDSLFCQILEVYPRNIPNRGQESVFAGYEVGIFSPDGDNNMWGNGGCGGHMTFNSSATMQLHYSDVQMLGYNIEESSIRVKYWDNHSGSWVEPAGQTLDPAANTVTFPSTEVSNFVILTGLENPLSVEGDGASPATTFTLRQNYPNPFNPATTIAFDLHRPARVTLTVYNALGQEVARVLNRSMSTGSHTVDFDGGNLPSGAYFYELKAGDEVQVRRMHLVK